MRTYLDVAIVLTGITAAVGLALLLTSWGL